MDTGLSLEPAESSLHRYIRRSIYHHPTCACAFQAVSLHSRVLNAGKTQLSHAQYRLLACPCRPCLYHHIKISGEEYSSSPLFNDDELADDYVF